MKNFLFLVFFFIVITCFGQKKDTVYVEPESNGLKDRRPRKATIMSAILPGLGQAYNHDYWKIPIIYAIEGTIFYFIINNQKQYKTYRQAYLTRMNVDTVVNAPVDQFYNNPQYQNINELKLDRDSYRNNRDLSIILFLLGWGLNILDADVSAHLNGFKINEDLSLHIKPFFYRSNNTNLATGLTFDFKLN